MRGLITLAAAASVALLAAFAAAGMPFGGATTQNGILTLVSNTGDAGPTTAPASTSPGSIAPAVEPAAPGRRLGLCRFSTHAVPSVV